MSVSYGNLANRAGLPANDDASSISVGIAPRGAQLDTAALQVKGAALQDNTGVARIELKELGLRSIQ